MNCKEISAKSALHSIPSGNYPYSWDMNIYRGCSHRCVYCFANYTHSYLNSKNFFDDIFVKTNIAELFEKEIASLSWKTEPICICGVTDCYQPIEETYKIMPKILGSLIKHKNPALIVTKSDLILRDIKLIEELAKLTTINIATTITTMDEALAKHLEPGAPTPEKRMKVLAKMKDIGCETTLLLMPILPRITDSKENLEQIFANAKECCIDNIYSSMLYLRGQTKENVMSFLKDFSQPIFEEYSKIFRKVYAPKQERMAVYHIIKILRKKYLHYSRSKSVTNVQTKIADFNKIHI